MKKLLLVAATSTAFLTSTASFAETGMFYLKAEGGASKLNTTGYENSNIKLKSNINGIFGVGVGYYLMDNVRTDITLGFLINPEFKGSAFEGINIKGLKFKASGQGKEKGNVKSLLFSGYVDLYNADTVRLFVGAGVGMAQVKEKSTGTVTFEVEDEDKGEVKVEKISGTISESSKNANNFAYQLTAGASFNLTNGIKLDITYSWKDYGETKAGKFNLNIKDKGMYSGRSSKSAYRGHNLMAGIRFDI